MAAAADLGAAGDQRRTCVLGDRGAATSGVEPHENRTFAAVAGYLPPDDRFEAMHHTPQSSQRARQIEVWAVLRTLGRAGVAGLVQREFVWMLSTRTEVLTMLPFTFFTSSWNHTA